VSTTIAACSSCFPEDKPLVDMHAKVISRAGARLVAAGIGHLVSLRQADGDRPVVLSVMETFAPAPRRRTGTRAGIRRFTPASTWRARSVRDLFEEAPIAYVHEGLDSRSFGPIAPL